MTETDGPSSYPVELAPREPPPRRRHRFITAPSGLVIFVCLFLPAVEVCGSPAYPYEAFGVQTPYLLGLLAGVVALVRPRRAISGLVLAMRIVLWLTVGGWGVFMLWLVFAHAELLPFAGWAAASGVMLALFGRGPRDENAAMRATLGSAVMAVVWFGLFCFDPGALYGTYAGAVAAVGLLVGALEWRRELGRDQSVVARAELR